MCALTTVGDQQTCEPVDGYTITGETDLCTLTAAVAAVAPACTARPAAATCVAQAATEPATCVATDAATAEEATACEAVTSLDDDTACAAASNCEYTSAEVNKRTGCEVTGCTYDAGDVCSGGLSDGSVTDAATACANACILAGRSTNDAACPSELCRYTTEVAAVQGQCAPSVAAADNCAARIRNSGTKIFVDEYEAACLVEAEASMGCALESVPDESAIHVSSNAEARPGTFEVLFEVSTEGQYIVELVMHSGETDSKTLTLLAEQPKFLAVAGEPSAMHSSLLFDPSVLLSDGLQTCTGDTTQIDQSDAREAECQKPAYCSKISAPADPCVLPTKTVCTEKSPTGGDDAAKRSDCATAGCQFVDSASTCSGGISVDDVGYIGPTPTTECSCNAWDSICAWKPMVAAEVARGAIVAVDSTDCTWAAESPLDSVLVYHQNGGTSGQSVATLDTGIAEATKKFEALDADGGDFAVGLYSCAAGGAQKVEAYQWSGGSGVSDAVATAMNDYASTTCLTPAPVCATEQGCSLQSGTRQTGSVDGAHSFAIKLRDRFNNVVDSSLIPASALSLVVTKGGAAIASGTVMAADDGTYAAEFETHVSGELEVGVELRGESLPISAPYTLSPSATMSAAGDIVVFFVVWFEAGSATGGRFETRQAGQARLDQFAGSNAKALLVSSVTGVEHDVVELGHYHGISGSVSATETEALQAWLSTARADLGSGLPASVGAAAGDGRKFSVQLYDQFSNRLENLADAGSVGATIKLTGGSEINLVAESSGGVVSFEYGQSLAGDYTISVYVLGAKALEIPVAVVALEDWSSVQSSIAGASSGGLVGRTETFDVHLKDAHRNLLAHAVTTNTHCEVTGVSQHAVADQSACRAEAIANGSPWYSYSSSPSFCITSRSCDSPVTGATWPWGTYETDLGDAAPFDATILIQSDLLNAGVGCWDGCNRLAGACDFCGSGVCDPNSHTCAAASEVARSVGWNQDRSVYEVSYTPTSRGTYAISIKSPDWDGEMARCSASATQSECTAAAGDAQKCRAYDNAPDLIELPGSSMLRSHAQTCTSSHLSACVAKDSGGCDSDTDCETEDEDTTAATESCDFPRVTSVATYTHCDGDPRGDAECARAQQMELASNCRCGQTIFMQDFRYGSQQNCQKDQVMGGRALPEDSGCTYTGETLAVDFLCTAANKEACVKSVDATQNFAAATAACSTGCVYSGSVCAANQIVYGTAITVALKDPPVLTKAAFQAGGAAVNFDFDVATDMASFAQLKDRGCEDIFAPSFLAKLGGAGAACTWDVNPTTGLSNKLIVRLESVAAGVTALAVSDAVYFKANAIYQAGGPTVSTGTSTAGAAAVIAPEGRTPPDKIVISSPSQVSDCAGAYAVINALNTPTVGLGGSTFTYSVPSDLSGSIQINAALAAQSSGLIYVDAALFSAGVEYPVTITFVNRWGDTPTAGAVTITLKKGSIRVSILGSSKAIDRGEVIEVAGNLILQSKECMDAAAASGAAAVRTSVNMLWTADVPVVQAMLDALPADSRGSPVSRLVLRIPALALAADTRFTLTFTAIPLNTDGVPQPAQAATATVDMDVPASKIVATIEQGSGDVSNVGEFVLDASGSFDPDNVYCTRPSKPISDTAPAYGDYDERCYGSGLLQISWACYAHQDASPDFVADSCFTDGSTGNLPDDGAEETSTNPGVLDAIAAGPVLRLAGQTLVLGRQLVFIQISYAPGGRFQYVFRVYVAIEGRVAKVSIGLSKKNAQSAQMCTQELVDGLCTATTREVPVISGTSKFSMVALRGADDGYTVITSTDYYWDVKQGPTSVIGLLPAERESWAKDGLSSMGGLEAAL